MSATNDDVVMEGTHDNADETPEPQTIANNTITPEQIHEIKKASKEKDKQIASLKLQLRNSRNNVEHQIKEHREATHAHFQAVKDDFDDEIENLMAENELLSRLLEDKREDFNDKHEKLVLACDMQEETISRQSNQLMQRRLECEAKDRKILQLTAEIEELLRRGGS
ncbi:MAG: SIR2-domain-containing protein [Aureobasidium pullulans]|nr:MAG: SIR2-domain-containing protein [Aureobasidium pullulans]